MARCLYCYQILGEGETDFHSQCSRKMFGNALPPEISFAESDIPKLAQQLIQSQAAIPGVQPKLSMGIERTGSKKLPGKLTVMGISGNFILKPQAPDYPNLPELEDLTMKLADLAGILTVPHSLVRLQSGHLAYITRRVDREDGKKIQMEDMCQLTGRLTENKYQGSYEQIAKVIMRHSARPGVDLIRFWETVIFCFLTGNNDMHLKNFSLIKLSRKEYGLCPAYDLIASGLVVQGDKEELALTLAGKKRKLKTAEFLKVMAQFEIPEKTGRFLMEKLCKRLVSWEKTIENSFIPSEMKVEYLELIRKRVKRLSNSL